MYHLGAFNRKNTQQKTETELLHVKIHFLHNHVERMTAAIKNHTEKLTAGKNSQIAALEQEQIFIQTPFSHSTLKIE